MRYPLTALVVAMALTAACKKSKPAPTAAAAVDNQARPSNPPAPAAVKAALDDSPSTQTNLPTRAPAAAAEDDKRVRLQVKWPVGNCYIYRMDLTQHSTNRLAAVAQPRQEDLTMGVTYALSIRQGSELSRQIEVEFLAYEVEIKVSDKVAITFDSADKVTQQDQNAALAPFRKLIGSKVLLQLNAQGRLDKVIGLADWAKTVAGEGTESSGQMLLQQFNEGYYQQMIDFAKGLSSEPVDVGAHWAYDTEVPAGTLGKITSQSTITLRRWEDHDQHRFAVLEAQGTLRGTPGPAVEQSATMSLDAGTLTGISWFDPELGALMESTVDQSMRLKGQVPASGAEQPAQSFTSDIGQKVTLKLVEVKNGH